jgi:non-homologous end joining protein Ku
VLHWPEHRRAYPAADVDVTAVTPNELRTLEKTLVPLHKSFSWEEYRDEGAERLNALVSAKLAARHAATQGAAGKRTKSASPSGAPRRRRAA